MNISRNQCTYIDNFKKIQLTEVRLWDTLDGSQSSPTLGENESVSVVY